MKTGVIINNIGTPQGFDEVSLKDYLGEFLMDPDVIGLPFPLRWLLVKKLIVPRRSKTSGAKYEKIWTPEGSPLYVESKKFSEKLQAELGSDYVVRMGMRYGKPSIGAALTELLDLGVEEIRYCPMYPQYAAATTFSAEQKFIELYRKMATSVPVQFLKPFYSQTAFLESSGAMLSASVQRHPGARVLFSFHGLPESHIKKNAGCLASPDCCTMAGACEKNCYRAHCLATAKKIAERSKVLDYLVSFQSRLGPAKWIGPSSLETVERLADQGVKSLIVMTPAFVADGLESLEEIDMELRHVFTSRGGVEFNVVKCLNDEPVWVRGFAAFFNQPALWREMK